MESVSQSFFVHFKNKPSYSYFEIVESTYPTHFLKQLTILTLGFYY